MVLAGLVLAGRLVQAPPGRDSWKFGPNLMRLGAFSKTRPPQNGACAGPSALMA